MTDDALEAVGLTSAHAVDLLLQPGDLAIWSPFLVHGSGNNQSSNYHPHSWKLWQFLRKRFSVNYGREISCRWYQFPMCK